MNNYYIIEVSGKNTYDFLERLIKHKINLYTINRYPNKIIIKVTLNDYYKIKKLKTLCKIKVIKILGIKKVYSNIKKYKITLLFFCFFAIIICFFSKMIFVININVDDEDFSKIIKNELLDRNITIYSFKKSYDDLYNICKEIKNKYKDKIEWINIDNKGIYYDVNVVLKDNKVIDDNNSYRDIISRYNGFIRDLYINRGNVIKNKDDYVSKGDIIVSGAITRDDKVTGYVNSMGNVYGEVWFLVKLESEKIYNKKIISKYDKTININLFDNDISLFKSISKSCINKDIYNGVFVKIKSDCEEKFDFKKSKYSDDELIYLMENKAKETILNTLNENEYIIVQKTLKKITYSDKIEMEVFFKVYKNLTSYKDTEIVKEGE